MLTKTNFFEWSLVMKVKLHAQWLWDAVRYGNADLHENRRALEALLVVAPMEMASTIVNKETTKDTWDDIAVAHVSSDCARKHTLQRLHQEWERLAFKLGEDVIDFALHLSGLVQ